MLEHTMPWIYQPHAPQHSTLDIITTTANERHTSQQPNTHTQRSTLEIEVARSNGPNRNNLTHEKFPQNKLNSHFTIKFEIIYFFVCYLSFFQKAVSVEAYRFSNHVHSHLHNGLRWMWIASVCADGVVFRVFLLSIQIVLQWIIIHWLLLWNYDYVICINY